MTTSDDVAGDVVTLDVSTLEPEPASRLVGETLAAAISAERPFAAVIRMPEHPAPRDRRLRNAGERVRLLKRLRPGLRVWCRGLAFVVSAQTQQANSKAIQAGARLWGCPTFNTDDAEAAENWARSRLDTEPVP